MLDSMNWCLAGTASASWQGDEGVQSGSASDINDDDTGTGYSVEDQGPSSGAIPTYKSEYTVEVEFAETALIIDTAEVYHYFGGSLNPNARSGTWAVSLYYSGGWNQVMNGSWTTASATQTDNISTGWQNVSKIKLYATMDGWVALMFPGYCKHETYELRAWGPPNFADSGIRVKSSSGTVSVAGQRLNATHKLRFRTEGKTVGIPLVATNDPDANGVRIYDGSAVKSLRNPD